jgi:tetratricopeptide (TPR) repeat protein
MMTALEYPRRPRLPFRVPVVGVDNEGDKDVPTKPASRKSRLAFRLGCAIASASAVALALMTNPASLAAQQVEPAWREYHRTAAAFLRSGDYRMALSILQQAREVAARDLGEDTKGYASFNRTLAFFARRAQDHDVTAAAVARALAISEKRWGPHSEHLLEDLRDLGYARLGQGDLEGAKRSMVRAMFIVRRRFGSANIYMASHIAHVSHALLQAGELKQAVEGFRAAVEYFVDNPAGASLELYSHAFAGYGAALKAAVDAGEMPADVAANATLQAIQKLWKSRAGTAISAMAEQADARVSKREQALSEFK